MKSTDPFQGFPNEPWGLKPERDHQEDEPQPNAPQAMLLYSCPVCGIWRDKAMAEVWRKAGQAFAAALIGVFGGTPQPVPEQQELTCPHGHGNLVQIQPDACIFVASDQIMVMPIENYQRAMHLEDAALTAWKHLEWMEDRGILTREEMPMLNGLRAIFAPEKVTE